MTGTRSGASGSGRLGRLLRPGTAPLSSSRPHATARRARPASTWPRAFAPNEALAIARAHWGIENGLHWMLDVHLGEDAARVRRDHAPANTALIARVARNLLQIAEPGRTPLAHRIRKCAWNDNYLLKVLAHMR